MLRKSYITVIKQKSLRILKRDIRYFKTFYSMQNVLIKFRRINTTYLFIILY